MANTLQPSAKQGFLGGDIAWDADTIKVVALDATYAYNAAHDNLDDVLAGARVVTSGALTAKTIAGGVADAADVTYVAVAAGKTITQLWVFKDTGVEGTSALIAFYDTKSDTTAIILATNGGDIVITWNAAGLFAL